MAIGGQGLLQALKYIVFLIVLVPLVLGGKVYNSLKALMGFKIAVVLGFLMFVAVLYSSPSTWVEIAGFFKFGAVPIVGDDLAAKPLIDKSFISLDWTWRWTFHGNQPRVPERAAW